MKKAPVWIRKVVYFTQRFPCAEERNRLLDEIASGAFDYAGFDKICREYHLAFDDNGNQISNKEYNYGAFYNKWEAINAAGKSGTIKSMQRVLHEHFNN